jgi:hypothetical protein
MADDPLIERTEGTAQERSGGRAMRAANLFDLRRIIAGVFGVWGVLLVILGLTESDAEIEKAAGVNINLWAGLGMLAISLVFAVWAFTRPLGEALQEAEEDDPSPRTGAPAPHGVDAAALASHQRSGRTRDDQGRSRGEPGSRREEP